MRRLVARFRKARSAVAAVEFAIAMPVFLMFIGGTLDFGFANYGRSALANAVAAGAHYAYLTVQSGGTVTASSLQTLIQTVSGLSNVTVTVTGPACYCVTGTGPTMASSTQCGTTPPGLCSDNTTPAGTYVIINATYAYQAMMPAYSHLAGATMTESATVQLK